MFLTRLDYVNYLDCSGYYVRVYECVCWWLHGLQQPALCVQSARLDM